MSCLNKAFYVKAQYNILLLVSTSEMLAINGSIRHTGGKKENKDR